MNHPLLIALCGPPGSGKSEVQKILEEEMGILPVDDGEILRRYTAELLDIDYQDTLTQEGKKKPIWVQDEHGMIVGRDVRWALGEMGNILEAKYGPYVIPNWAIRKALRAHADYERSLDTVPGYSFGSVRKQQGWAYRNAGGIVVEVVRTGTEPTGYGFDLYDRKAVSFVFRNDFDTLAELRAGVRVKFPGFIKRARRLARDHAQNQEAA